MSTKKSLLIFFFLSIVLSSLAGLSLALSPAQDITTEEQAVSFSQRPDSPTDAPTGHINDIGLLTVGETTITYELAAKKVRFRVNDGYDLNQYLFADSSPLDFYIDLHGFQPHPTEPAQVTLRVWDVDQHGAPGFPQCQVELDHVYVNGVFLGALTGADNQWSTVTFSIPPGTLTGGNNHFWVDIDVLTGSCWAVQVDWAEVEIPFSIAHVESSSFDDVTIKRGATDDVITNPIWQTGFDTGGNMITPANPDDPIADKIRGGWFGIGARQFKYSYKLDTWPAGTRPTWQPRVSYSWEIAGTSQNSGGFVDLSGWENDFNVTLPDTVGKYTLNVTLKIYHGDELLRTENRAHTLYVIWDTPVASVTASGVTIPTGQPRTAWLDIATNWAGGQNTVVNILNGLNNSAYGGGNNPLGWGYGYPKVDPVTLIETGAGQNGDCYVFRDVWRLLAASLGISTGQTDYWHNTGFITSLRPALENNASANARNAVSGSRDRWIFSNHQYGSYGGQFYDPTFGLTGPNSTAGKESNIFCKVDGTEAGFTRCSLLSPPPARALLRPSALPPINGWSIVDYTTAATFSSFSDSSPIGLSDYILQSAGTFTGNSSDHGNDADSNGLFEHLQFNIEVDVVEAGNITLFTLLTDAGGNLISLGTLVPDLDNNAPVMDVTVDVGLQTLPVYFNGLAIRTAAVDGPYTIEANLLDDQGQLLDTATFVTAQAYSYQAFQGLLFEIESLADRGVDTDTVPGYNYLQVTADINALASGEMIVLAQLFAGDTFLADTMHTLTLESGLHSADFNFPGEAIAMAGLDGPYTVYLNYSDAYYSDSQEYTTAPYSFTDFQPPITFFSGNISDTGHDSDGNGLYETLAVTAEVVTFVPGLYTLHGILQDNNGSFIDATDVLIDLSDMLTDVTLHFDGRRIHRHAVDGPYQVMLVITDDSSQELAGTVYTTSAYSFTTFERPGAAFNGNFSDSGIDSDGNGFYDALRIQVGVQVVMAGTYVVDGSLHDSSGNFITAAREERFLAAGTHLVNLDFSGQAINNHGVDGPYHLMALDLIQDDVGSVDVLLDAYQTAAYTYNQFQPTGLSLTGNFTDFGEDTNGNGLYNYLVIGIELSVDQSNTYFFNARLVDANGDEIVWGTHSQFLTPGIHLVNLRFDGRYIYGSGVDGPYDLKNLSIYTSNQSLSLVDVYSTSAYSWEAFEPAGVVTGRVTVDSQPVANATVFISGVDSDQTNSAGEYRLTVFNSGLYTVWINAEELGPWQIWVNGELIGEGNSVTLPLTVGQVTMIDFVITNILTVDVDITPHHFPNLVVPSSNNPIVVAVLSSPQFDAQTIDPLSVAFGPTGATPKGGQGYFKDVNSDGYVDIVFHFVTNQTGIQCGDTSASLTGETYDGQQIEGSDSIVIVGCINAN